MDKENQKTSSQIKNSEYKELVDFLVVKFDEVNDKLDQKADKSEVIALNSKVEKILDRVVRLSDKVGVDIAAD
ncbi:MAG: hypothetical protein WCX69_02145 [Candidatus Paceibacterota bacterium]